MDTKTQIRDALAQSLADGLELLTEELSEHDLARFAAEYQKWYTVARRLVEGLASDRISEFDGYYTIDPRRKQLTALTYSIQDFVMGMEPVADFRGRKPFDAQAATVARFNTQIQILAAIDSRVDQAIADVEGHLAADLEDAQLSEANQLKRTSLRAAGAVAGVVLERHLLRVAANRRIAVRKKRPTIGDVNEKLKAENVYDLPTYRRIQFLADVRNICTHDRQREPTEAEVDELIRGVDTVVKTIH